MYAYYKNEHDSSHNDDDDIPPPPMDNGIDGDMSDQISILDLADSDMYSVTDSYHHPSKPTPSARVEHMLTWERERQRKIEMKRQDIEEQRIKSFRDPQITKMGNKSRNNQMNTVIGSTDCESVDGGRVSPTESLQSSVSTQFSRVEDRLHEYGKLTQIKRDKRVKEKETNMKNESKLTLVADHPLPEGYDHVNVVDRLTGSSSTRDTSHTSGFINKKDIPNQRDIFTGQKFFEPVINRTSEKLAARLRDPSQPIEDVLHARGMEYQIRAKLREEKQIVQSHRSREASKLNQVSEQIVREKELLSGETANQRLHRPIGEVKAHVLESIEKHSFKPKINKKSEEIVLNSFGHLYVPPAPNGFSKGGNATPAAGTSSGYGLSSRSGSFIAGSSASGGNMFYADDASNKYFSSSGMDDDYRYDGDKLSPNQLLDPSASYYYDIDDGVFTLDPMSNGSVMGDDVSMAGSVNDPVTAVQLRSAAWLREKGKRLEKERREREKEMEKICSFKPKLKENKSFASKTEFSDSNPSITSIADRQVAWMKKREDRLEAERRKKEAEELDGYTFQPQIIKSSSSSHSVKSSTCQKPVNSDKPSVQISSNESRPVSSINQLDSMFRHNTETNGIVKTPSFRSNISVPSDRMTSLNPSLPSGAPLAPRIISGKDRFEPSIEDRIAMLLNGWDDEVISDPADRPKIPVSKASFSYSKS